MMVWFDLMDAVSVGMDFGGSGNGMVGFGSGMRVRDLWRFCWNFLSSRTRLAYRVGYRCDGIWSDG